MFVALNVQKGFLAKENCGSMGGKEWVKDI